MGVFNIRKGRRADLNQASYQEDGLLICDNGEVFYDFDQNNRIPLNLNVNDIFDYDTFYNKQGLMIGNNTKGKQNFTFANKDYSYYYNDTIYHIEELEIPLSALTLHVPDPQIEGDTYYLEGTYQKGDAEHPIADDSLDYISTVTLFNNINAGDYFMISVNGELIHTYITALSGNTTDLTYCMQFNSVQPYSHSVDVQRSQYILGIQWTSTTTQVNLLDKINTDYASANYFDTSQTQRYDDHITQLVPNDGVTMSLKVYKGINSGRNSVVIGENNKNEFRNNITVGTGLKNVRTNSALFGQYNDFTSQNYLLSVGNGSSTNLRNAFGVNTSGQVNATRFSSNGADYAEYFEWKNIPDIKDIRGLFVTLDKNKIRLANKNDKYILGAISANPGVIGNNTVEEWQGKYETDIFGCKKLDAAGQEILVPEYDKNIKYKSREERAEWALVALMGQVIVVDDGSCVEGEFCTVGENGVATAATQDGYYVMERLDDNHIKICLK